MKASPILLIASGELRYMGEHEREPIRRFLTQHLRGADRQHQQRWLRLAGDFFNAEPGEGFQLYRAESRSGPFHRLHRAVLGALFERQERFTNEDKLHDWIKLQCWFVEWVNGYPVPRSTNYDDCSEDEVREFHARMVELLQEPHVQRHFWAHLPPARRQEMVDGILTNPKEDRG